MKIAIGCDHIVTDVKNRLALYLRELGHEVYDCGTFDFERTHYPIFGKKVAELVVNDAVDLGVVMCGTGVGITNSANKVQGARVALVGDVIAAKNAKECLDANVIGVGGRVLGFGAISEIVETFINTKFIDNEENRKNVERIKQVEQTASQSNLFDDLLVKWDEGGYTD